MSVFVRVYEVDGVEYICSGGCDVRGPSWEARDILSWDDVTCPSCLKLAAEFRKGRSLETDGRLDR